MKLLSVALGSLALGASLLSPLSAEARYARVCTRHYDGLLNLRALPSTSSRVAGRARNSEQLRLSGGFHDGSDGYTWYQLKTGSWVRGDFLCKIPVTPPPAPTPTGPGNYWGK